MGFRGHGENGLKTPSRRRAARVRLWESARALRDADGPGTSRGIQMPGRHIFRLIAFAIAACFAAPTTADARTHRVPSDYGTIQAGIDAASEGDTILVAPGTYAGEGNRNVLITLTDFVLVSEAGAEATSIDAESSGQCLKLTPPWLTGSSGVLDGFTFTHATGDSTHKSAVYYSGMNETIGGLTIRNCDFVENYNGALCLVSAAEKLISNCSFVRNEGVEAPCIYSSADSWRGGDGEMRIVDCQFSSNRSTNGSGAVVFGTTGFGKEWIVERCTFTDNFGGRRGGATQSYPGGGAKLVNCQFVGNESPFGGAVYINGGNPDRDAITNCTFVDNVSDLGGAVMIGIGADRISNSVFRGNLPLQIMRIDGGVVQYSNVEGGYEGEGNIDADPLFAAPGNGDYHLTDGSPCVDTGTADGAPDTDFEGDPRPSGDGYDMGADEHGGGGAPCDLEVALSNYPERVERGGRLSFRADASNGCDDELTFDRAVMNITGPASLENVLYVGAPFTVVGSVGKDLSLACPPGAPLGTYTIEVTIYRDGEAIDADAFEVDVTG